MSEPLSVTCPACQASPGEPCTQPTDTSRRPVPWLHSSRQVAADAAAEAEVKRLAHSADPDTSAAAVPKHEQRATVKDALLTLLADLGGFGSVPVLTMTYFQQREERGWPDIQPYSVARRMSELKTEGRVQDSGGRVPGPNGRNVTVWEVTRWN